MKYDVIIIGAGAAGLMAMRDLLEAGHTVCMLEASSIAGGRIATINEPGFDMPIEAGAEFIHGKLPVTFKLIKEAGLSYEAVKGDMIGVQNGNWQKEEHDEHWDEFARQLEKLKTDLSIHQFLEEYFSDPKYVHLRQAVQRMAEGFDLADISKTSILSVKNEWKNIDKKQYRINGGYIGIINYLLDSCMQSSNTTINFNTCVCKIEYSKGHVIVHINDKKEFTASKLIITVSAGVLQSGAIQFKPELTDHAVAINSLGFGTVIKILLQFKTMFWKEYADNIGFLLTDEEIPTWWTQLPTENNLLTGWLGGPAATKKAFESEESLLKIALQSLSSIFHISIDILEEQLTHYKIINWLDKPYIKGGYCYNSLNSEQARKLLATPVHNTLYFAGEALLDGGTVEDALKSGRNAATRLIVQYTTQKQE